MSNNFNNLPDRSIGKKLRSIRESKVLTIKDISLATKIRTEYIDAIEKDNFSKFDSHVYAKGFIKNYALFLGENYEPLIALYRRDFENIDKKRKTQSVKKEPSIERKKLINTKKLDGKITKRRVAYALAIIFFAFILISLVAFLQNTFKPPLLRITKPEIIEGEIFKRIQTQDKSIRLEGQTDPNTLIKVNDEPVALKPGHTFETDFLPISSETNIINIEAISQLGTISKIQLEIIREDLKEQKTVEGDAIFIIKEKPVFLLIRSDGIIKFNDIAVPNEAINITADRFIEVETSEPQYVTLQINEQSFQLEHTFERFELGEEILRLSN